MAIGIRLLSLKIAALACGGMFASAAFAAPLNLVKTYPDFTLASDQAYAYNATTDLITITGTIASYTEGLSSTHVNEQVTNNGAYLEKFSLTAVINSLGQLISGSFYIDGVVRDPFPTILYNGQTHSSGHLLSGDLTHFGWAGTSGGSGGILEFKFNNADGVIADLNGGYYGGGMILTVTSSTLGLNNFGSQALTTSWTGSGYGDVFVPLPAAAWLFGSALLAVGGLGARRKSYTLQRPDHQEQ